MAKNWISNTLQKVNNVKTKKKNRVQLSVTKAPERETITVPKLKPVPKMELAIKPNYARLTMLLDMRTYSKGPLQDKLITKLQEHFTSLGATAYKDSYGNLYVIKGNAEFYPCVVGHTDINQTVRGNVKVMTEYPWMFGFDLEEGEQAGIGADDKVGVYFAVHMFDLFDNIKLFFPKDEEVGLIGTYRADKQFFADCSMLVQLDRNSYKNDLITYTNGITVCSQEFVEAAQPIMNKYMYAKNNGSCTDIGGIKKFDTVKCVAMNVSCGYINEHGDDERISIPHFENAINFGYELLKMGVNKVWSHEVKVEVYENTPYGTYGTYANFGGYKGPKYDLFDDLEEVKQLASFSSYETQGPTGKVVLLKEHKDQDEYMLSLYPELMDNDYREKYLTHIIGYPESRYHLAQDEIDECITDHVCPNCWSDLQPNNSLLLYTYCESCDTTFNTPNVSLDVE
jgi:tripeptide aminopeptidase